MLSFFNKRKHIAHSENSLCHSVGVERFDFVKLFSRSDKFYRFTGYIFDGKRGTAARIAVKLCHYPAGDIEHFVKGFCDVHGVLTCHRVDYEKYFRRGKSVFHAFQLIHHIFIYLKSAGCIYNNKVKTVFLCVLDGVFGNFYGRF